MFIHIFCQADSPLRPKQITDFIDEGAYFDDAPKSSLVPASVTADSTHWTELKIEYKARKRPVVLHRETRSEEFMEEVGEAIEALEEAGLTKKHEDLLSRLKGTRQLIAFEIDSKGASEECWEMVDSLEAWIAREYRGLIYVAGEGFYNEELKAICKL